MRVKSIGGIPLKKVLILILTVLLAVSLAGCSLDSLEDYRKAAEKTDQIEKGKMSGNFMINMDFDTSGMTDEQIRKLNYFRKVEGSFNASYDDGADKGIFRNYLNFGGLGFDFDVFINGEEIFLRLPILGKYMRLDEIQESMKIKDQADEEPRIISREAEDEISAKWLGVLNKEDVFKGKDIVLTTPDGEVKTKEYSIKLDSRQIKELAEQFLEILSKDETLKENYEKYIIENGKQPKDISPEKFVSDIKEGIKKCKVEDFNYTAHVDIDGYIVNEAIKLSVKIEDPDPGSMTGFDYSLELKNWDINRKQEFEFPELTKENTVDIDQIDRNMPFVMDDFFTNID